VGEVSWYPCGLGLNVQVFQTSGISTMGLVQYPWFGVEGPAMFRDGRGPLCSELTNDGGTHRDSKNGGHGCALCERVHVCMVRWSWFRGWLGDEARKPASHACTRALTRTVQLSWGRSLPGREVGGGGGGAGRARAPRGGTACVGGVGGLGRPQHAHTHMHAARTWASVCSNACLCIHIK
jgi:hypothetical protein